MADSKPPVLITLYAGALGNPKQISPFALWVQGVGPLQMTSHESSFPPVENQS